MPKSTPELVAQQTLRNHNLSSLLGTLLRHDEATRKQVERETGLSKATVSRLVDDLLNAGVLKTHRSGGVEPGVRGRRPESLGVARALGACAGLSMGVRTTDVRVVDLRGVELAHEQHPTPRWTDLAEAVDWSVAIVSAIMRGLGRRLRRVVVAVPARPIGGHALSRLPLFMSAIEGSDFGRLLGGRLGCSVRIELDAAMIHTGLEVLRLLDRNTFPVLLNLGSVLTMSIRRADGTVAEGRTPAFGDFNLIPVETELGTLRAGRLLGAHGLFELSRDLGRELTVMEDLWQTDSPEVQRLRRAFALALAQAVRTIVVMSDPRGITFTGRMAPLVERSLDEVRMTLGQEVDQPPRLRVVTYTEEGRAAAIGAADEARADAKADLLERVSREGVEALREGRPSPHPAV